MWVPHDIRDRVVDYVHEWNRKTEISVERLVAWLGIRRSKFYNWRNRYGKANEHNGKIPRDFWLEPWEKDAIIRYHLEHPLDGYRRLTFMMLDDNVVAVAPAADSAQSGGRFSGCEMVCESLQHGTPARSYRIRHAEGQTRRQGQGNLGGAGLPT